MPPKPKYRFNDPFFNEFVFHTVLNAPPDVKNRLPLELLKHTTTIEKIKRFADGPSLEKKLEMLSRLGGSFSLTVAPPRYLDKEKLQQVLDNFLAQQRLADVDEMLERFVFVTTDRELMAIHNVMAMNCHSDTYMLNRDYSLVATQITSGERFNPKITDIERVKEVMEDHKLLCKLMLYNLLHQDYVDNMNGYKSRELLVLLYLFLNRNQYVNEESLHDFFKSLYSPSILSRVLLRLTETLHVGKFPGQFRYTITGLGIQVIGQYVNRILNQTLSF